MTAGNMAIDEFIAYYIGMTTELLRVLKHSKMEHTSKDGTETPTFGLKMEKHMVLCNEKYWKVLFHHFKPRSSWCYC